MRGVLLGFGHQRLDELTQRLGFGHRRLDALVQDERRCHVRHQGLAVSRLTPEVIEILIMSHS